MKRVKSAALVVMSGWLMGVSASAWAAMPAVNMAQPNHAEVIAAANGPLFATEGSLEPSLALQVARQDHGKCKASRIYGAADVVGDKNICIMGGYEVPGAYGGGMATGGR
jgi:hypothetical protein